MKKILIVTSSLHKNGTETFIMNLYRRINRARMQFDFLISSEPDGFYEEILSLGGTVYITCSRRKNVIKNYLEVKRFFRNHSSDYEAVHYCGGSLSEIIHIVQAYKCRIPIRIIHGHNSSCDSLFSSIMHRINKKRISKIATHFWACSKSAAKWFYEGVIPEDQIRVIPNGINIDKFVFNPKIRNNIRASLNITNDEMVIGHVGRFTEVKNHTFLIDVFKCICDHKIKAKLLLLGDGELFEIIKQKVDALSLTDKVIFAGRKDNINEYMQAMDCFVMPSLYEGLPFVLLEAQSSALPIIASDIISCESDITNSITFLSLNSNAEEWANCIIENIQVNDYRRNMSTIVAKAGYSDEEMASFIENIYLSNNHNKLFESVVKN